MRSTKSFDAANRLAQEFDFLVQGAGIPNEKEVRQQASDAVSKDVRQNKLIDNDRFPKHAAKSQGMFPGCIFEGVNKAGRTKKIFVKHYSKTNVAGDIIDSEHDSFVDYAVFRILKHCGARAPKVRFKASQQEQNKYNYYLFSTDVTHPCSTHLDKSYWYGDIEGGQIRYMAEKHLLSSCSELLPKQSQDDEVEFKRAFHRYDIDNRSAARLLILGLILQLKDLHVQNVGFVLSRKNDVVKAKPVFIDFYADKTELNVKKHSDLMELLRSHYNKDHAADMIRGLLENIPHEEFVLAFNDIEQAGFMEIYDKLLHEADSAPELTSAMKQEYKSRMEVIKLNFCLLLAHIKSLQSEKTAPAESKDKKCIIC